MQDNTYLKNALRFIAQILKVIGLLYILVAVVIMIAPRSYRPDAFFLQESFAKFMPYALKGSFVYPLPYRMADTTHNNYPVPSPNNSD